MKSFDQIQEDFNEIWKKIHEQKLFKVEIAGAKYDPCYLPVMSTGMKDGDTFDLSDHCYLPEDKNLQVVVNHPKIADPMSVDTTVCPWCGLIVAAGTDTNMCPNNPYAYETIKTKKECTCDFRGANCWNGCTCGSNK